MEPEQLKAAVEALIFAAEEPLSLAGLAALLEEDGVTRGEVKEAVAALQAEKDSRGGIFLREIGGGFQFVTRPETARWVGKLNAAKPKTLSQAAMETLAILAYRQPLVRSDLEAIRGVDSGGVLKTLLERGLIRILGRREEAGQPLIYGTTHAFLELFHLRNLEELPSLKEIEAMVEEQNRQTEEPPDGEIVAMETPVLELSEEELGDEEKIMADLDESLKNLRKLEREVFPKPPEAENSAEEPSPEPPSENTKAPG